MHKLQSSPIYHAAIWSYTHTHTLTTYSFSGFGQVSTVTFTSLYHNSELFLYSANKTIFQTGQFYKTFDNYCSASDSVCAKTES